VPRLARQGRAIGGDPVPYGIGANEPSLKAMVRFATDQGLLDADFPAGLRSLFAAGDYPDA
jgi:4,5-dihydroxyphthalate decarboxylase